MKKGFTLIELLVVISIIGMMSSVVLSSVNIARDKAANSARTQVALFASRGLMMFRAENGYYPAITSGPGFDTGYSYACLVNKTFISGFCYTGINYVVNSAIKNALSPYYKFSEGEDLYVYDDEDSGSPVHFIGPVYYCVADTVPSSGRCQNGDSPVMFWYMKGTSSNLCQIPQSSVAFVTPKGYTACVLTLQS